MVQYDLYVLWADPEHPDPSRKRDTVWGDVHEEFSWDGALEVNHTADPLGSHCPNEAPWPIDPHVNGRGNVIGYHEIRWDIHQFHWNGYGDLGLLLAHYKEPEHYCKGQRQDLDP